MSDEYIRPQDDDDTFPYDEYGKHENAFKTIATTTVHLTSEQRRSLFKVSKMYFVLRKAFREWNEDIRRLKREYHSNERDVEERLRKGYARLEEFHTELWKLEVDIKWIRGIDDEVKIATTNELRDMANELYLHFYNFLPSVLKVSDFKKPVQAKYGLSFIYCAVLSSVRKIPKMVSSRVPRLEHVSQLSRVLSVLLCETSSTVTRMTTLRSFLLGLVECGPGAYEPRQSCKPPSDPAYTIFEDCCLWTGISKAITSSPSSAERVNSLWRELMYVLKVATKKELTYRGEVPDAAAYATLYQNISRSCWLRAIRYLEESAKTPLDRYHIVASVLITILGVTQKPNSIENIVNMAIHIVTARDVLSSKAIYAMILLGNAFAGVDIPESVDEKVISLLSKSRVRFAINFTLNMVSTRVAKMFGMYQISKVWRLYLQKITRTKRYTGKHIKNARDFPRDVVSHRLENLNESNQNSTVGYRIRLPKDVDNNFHNASNVPFHRRIRVDENANVARFQPGAFQPGSFPENYLNRRMPLNTR